jgi:quercetin dioxygenase-like cupin family protein
MRTIAIAAGLALAASTANGQATAGTGTGAGVATHAIVLLPDRITWGPAPTILPPGAEVAVLEGDPAKPGPFTMRLRVSDGYRIPAHFHPAVEHVTVIAGTFRVGMGDRFDAGKLTDLPVGTFAALEPGVRHFAQARGATVIQLHGIGPWSLTYVNPADDPRGRTP